jgi:hypothetical protein
MSSSNQIFLVMDAGQPKGCLHHQARDASLPEASARCVHQPACLYVLEQSRAVNHDHVGGAGGIMFTDRENLRDVAVMDAKPPSQSSDQVLSRRKFWLSVLQSAGKDRTGSVLLKSKSTIVGPLPLARSGRYQIQLPTSSCRHMRPAERWQNEEGHPVAEVPFF